MMLRDFKAEDKEGCNEVFESNIGYTLAENEQKDFNNFLDKLPQPQARYYVVTDEERIVACGGFWIDRKLQRSTLCWGLVHRAVHGQGVGRLLLLSRLREVAALPELTTVALDTSQFTYAFFAKHGFAIERITENFYAPGYHRYDMIMSKERILQELR